MVKGKLKEEEILSLNKNGVDYKRIESLKKSLKGYSALKKEVTKMEKLVLSKDKEIEEYKKRGKKYKKLEMLSGLK